MIAANMGSHVDFGARYPQGPASVSMFLSHASPTALGDVNGFEEIRGILDLCAGLPIALAITGQAVVLRVTLGLGFRRACQTYLDELSQEMYPGALFCLWRSGSAFVRWKRNATRRKPTFDILSTGCTQVFAS